MFRIRAAYRSLIILGILIGRPALAQNFSDLFANRQLLTGATAVVTGANDSATVESGEPKILGKVGGHSLWVSWQAPSDGLVTLDTFTSSFDTLLGAYVLEPGNDPAFQRLESVAANDDYGGQVTSYLQFGANAGQTYQISVDGFNGAVGNAVLHLNFLSSSNLQPTVVGVPGDQALRLGDPLILTVNFLPSPNLEFRWYLNGSPVAGSDDDSVSPTLVIPSLQQTNLGLYSLKFTLDDDSFFSQAIEIQVNSEGLQNVLARTKLADAAASGLTANIGGSGVLLGYNGTQIFDTTSALVDPNAPTICGVAPGPAYWFAYQAPASGTMTINTVGSSFATLLAAFTYTGTLVSYANLSLVACDNNNGGTGSGSSSVQFPVTAGANYYIVVGGVGGARGPARLNYTLNAGQPAAAPTIVTQPHSLTAVTQTAVALSTVPGGTAPFSYQWLKNGSVMRQQTNASLLFRSPQMNDNATYSVVVTNYSGAVTSATARLSVINAPITQLNSASQLLVYGFPGIRGYRYSVDTCTDLVASAWSFWTNGYPDYGGVIWVTNNPPALLTELHRVHTP
jgi:hypothetical protein